MPSLALVERELLVTLRRPRTLACVGAVALVCGVTAIVMWRDWLVLPGCQSEFLFVLTLIVSTVSVAIVPGIAATAIATERERQTLDLLYLAPIRPVGILAAKVTNAIGLPIITLIAVMPFLALGFSLGGGDSDVFVAMGLAALLIVMCGFIGVCCSAFFRDTNAALVSSYVITVCALLCSEAFAAPFGWRVIQVPQFPGFPGFTQTQDAFVPVGHGVVSAIRTLLTHEHYSLQEFILPAVYMLIVCVICLVVGWWRLQEPLGTLTRRQRKGRAEPAPPDARWKRPTGHLFMPRIGSRPIPDRRNPVLAMELRRGLAGRWPILVVACGLALVAVSLLSAHSFFLDYSDDHVYYSLLGLIVLGIVLNPGLMASRFVTEHDQGNLDMLQMTLLRPRTIIRGKLGAALALPVIFIATILYGIAPMVVYAATRAMWGLLLTGFATLFVCLLVSFAVSLAAPQFTRRTTTVLVASYVIDSIVFVGLATATRLLLALHYWKSPWDFYWKHWRETRLWGSFLSPILAFSANYEWHRNDGVDLINLYWLGNTALFVTLALFIIYVSFRRFERLYSRAE